MLVEKKKKGCVPSSSCSPSVPCLLHRQLPGTQGRSICLLPSCCPCACPHPRLAGFSSVHLQPHWLWCSAASCVGWTCPPSSLYLQGCLLYLKVHSCLWPSRRAALSYCLNFLLSAYLFQTNSLLLCSPSPGTLFCVTFCRDGLLLTLKSHFAALDAHVNRERLELCCASCAD